MPPSVWRALSNPIPVEASIDVCEAPVIRCGIASAVAGLACMKGLPFAPVSCRAERIPVVAPEDASKASAPAASEPSAIALIGGGVTSVRMPPIVAVVDRTSWIASRFSSILSPGLSQMRLPGR